MILTDDVGTVQREAWANKVLPPVEQVRDGLWSIPVPMPENPLRYVLVYALALDDGLALIDVGWDDERSWRALVDAVASIGYHISQVRYAAITHLHPDHFGLAPRLREVSGASLAMHVADATLLGHHGPEQTLDDIDAWNLQLSDFGAPAEVADAPRAELVRFGENESIDVVLGDGDSLDLPGWNLRAVWTPGHTPGHLCFVEDDKRLMFSGDHMLPRISPNISSTPGELEDPLHRYLISLQATETLGDCEVLPAHEYRFRGIADRARQLMGHHEDRLAEIVAAVKAKPQSTAWELSGFIGWSRPFDEMSPRLHRLAVRETHAHLVVLVNRGILSTATGSPLRWTLAAS